MQDIKGNEEGWMKREMKTEGEKGREKEEEERKKEEGRR
jgi:hypothetical protein